MYNWVDFEYGRHAPHLSPKILRVMKAVYSHHNLPKPDGVKTPSFLAGLGYQVASPDATEPSEVRLSFIDFQSSRKPHFTINLTTPGEIHDEIGGYLKSSTKCGIVYVKYLKRLVPGKQRSGWR